MNTTVRESDAIGMILLKTSTMVIIMIISIVQPGQILLNANHIAPRIRTVDLSSGRGNIVAGGRRASVNMSPTIRQKIRLS